MLRYIEEIHPENFRWYVTPPPIDALHMLLHSLLLFSFAAWYFSQLGGTDCRPEEWYFPLRWTYWAPSASVGSASLSELQGELRLKGAPCGLDSDVTAEAHAVCSRTPSVDGVTLLDLGRTFASYRLKRGRIRRHRFTAVKEVHLALDGSQCFALLGHNGAGKTTTIKMVTAQIKPTTGDVSVLGLSVNHDAAAVRQLLGICPQHDILYHELTAREHLLLYGSLKGIAVSSLREKV